MQVRRGARRVQFVLAAAVMLALGAGRQAMVARADGAADASADSVANRLIVDLLVDEARVRVRDPGLTRELAIKQSLVLLKMAYQRDNKSPDVLLLLDEAAESGAEVATKAGDLALADADIDLARRAIKDLLKVDPGHLWAYVRWMDLLVRGRPVDEKIKIFRAAMDNTAFDPQVRSEAGTRIGRLLLERGDVEEAVKTLREALVLNDVNVGAWQELAKIMDKTGQPAPDRLGVLVKLLCANPYQPDAWAAGAHILAAAGMNDEATDWLIAAVEQYRASGIQPAGEMYVDLATQMGLANRRVEASNLIGQMMQFNGGPAVIPSIGYVIKSGGLLPGAPDDDMLSEAQKRLTAAVNVPYGPEDKAAVSAHNSAVMEAVWFELFAAPTVGKDMPERLAALKAALGDDSPLYMRLVGWQQIRDGKFDDAKATLTPLVDKDVFASIGLLRIARLQNDDKTARELVTKLWKINPTGIEAIVIQGEAGRLNMVQPKSPLAGAVQEILKSLPKGLLTAHRTPRDVVLIDPSLPKRSYAFGEPVVLNIKFVNATDRAISVGPNGVMNTSVIVGGTLRGIGAQGLGIFATENNPRVFRVERRATVEEDVRVDQAQLRDVMYNNPTRMISVSLNVTSAPHATEKGWAQGLGGQRVQAGEFDRQGMKMNTLAQMMDMIRTLVSKPVDERMLDAQALQSFTYNLPEDTTQQPAGEGASTQQGLSLAQVRAESIKTLADQIKTGDPRVQAWLVRWAPLALPSGIEDAMNTVLPTATDPVTRVVAYERALKLVKGKQAEREALGKKMHEAAAAETDPLVKQWVELLSQEAAIVPQTPPAAPAPAAP